MERVIPGLYLGPAALKFSRPPARSALLRRESQIILSITQYECALKGPVGVECDEVGAFAGFDGAAFEIKAQEARGIC